MHCPGCTPLHLSILRNDTKISQKLLSAGADPNIPDAHGWTPLHYVGMYRMDDFLATNLVGHGADMYFKGPENITPMDTMKNDQKYSMLTQWTQIRHFRFPLAAAAIKNSDKIREQLSYGPTQKELDYALFLVHYLSVLELLLDARANPDVRDDFGRTPLHFSHNTNLIEPLIRAGTDVNAQDHLGRTALHFADPELAQELLNNGADPWIRDRFGRNTLETRSDYADIAGYIPEEKLPGPLPCEVTLDTRSNPRVKCKATLLFNPGGRPRCSPPPMSRCYRVDHPKPRAIDSFVGLLVKNGDIRAIKRLARYGVRFDMMPGVIKRAKKALPEALPVFDAATRNWRRRLCRYLPEYWYGDEDDCYFEYGEKCEQLDEYIKKHPDFANDPSRLAWTMLHNGDYSQTARLVESGLVHPMDMNHEFGSYKSTLLAAAVSGERVHLVQRLLNVLIKQKRSPFATLMYSDDTLLDTLIKKIRLQVEEKSGAEPDYKALKRIKRMMKAALNAAKAVKCPIMWGNGYARRSVFDRMSADAVKWLGTCGFDLSLRDNFGSTLLSANLSPEALKWLAENVIDPNPKGNYKYSSLFEHYNPERLEALIEGGADPTVKNRMGIDPVLSHKHYYSALVLGRAQAKWTNNWSAGALNPVFNAMSAKDVENAISEGHSIDLAGARGITPLHIAVYKKETDVVKALIDHNVALNPRLK